jgi:hypothetical protein
MARIAFVAVAEGQTCAGKRERGVDRERSLEACRNRANRPALPSDDHAELRRPADRDSIGAGMAAFGFENKNQLR